MDSSRSRLACLGVVAVTVALFALLRAPFLSLPLERDEGEYAYIAQRIAVGDVPYRDAFDQKPPAVFVAYRVAFALFGESIEAIHFFLYLWTAATAAWLFALVRRLAGDLAAAFATLVFSITAADPRIVATAANTEIFMLLPLVGSLDCWVRGIADDRARWWIACGFLAALACWFKQVAIMNAVFVGAALVAARWRELASGRARATLRDLLLIAAGGLLASAPVLLYFAAVGAWRPFVDAVFLHNLRYAQSVSLADGLAVLAEQLSVQAPSFALFWAAAGVAALVPSWIGRRSWLLLLGFAAASAAGVSLGFYFRPHYFVQLLPALSALCGVSLGAAAVWLLRRAAPVAWTGLFALVVVVIAPPVWANRDLLWAESEAEISRQIYGINPFPEMRTIGAHIRNNSEPDDSVFVVGSEPEVLFYSQRASATRYIFFYPLTGEFPDAYQRQLEVVRDAAARRPRYVVWVNIGTSIAVGEATGKDVFRAISVWLRRNYRLEMIARPGAEYAEFDFIHGEEGQRLLESLEGRMADNPWVALFRRVR